MSNENYQFDEGFRKLLIRGVRREISAYRNAIIDELKLRGEIGVEKGSEKQKLDLKIERLSVLLMVIAGTALVCFLLWYASEISQHQELTIEAWGLCLIIPVLVWIILFNLRMSFNLKMPQPPKGELEKKPGRNSETATTLRNDSTEVLKAKKEILDKRLGL